MTKLDESTKTGGFPGDGGMYGLTGKPSAALGNIDQDAG